MVGQKKLLLLGGTGFVGSHVLHNALQSGWRVVCASRGGVPKPGVPLLDAALQQYYYGSQQHTSPPNMHMNSKNNNNNNNNNMNSNSEEEGRLQCFTPSLEFVSLDATSRSQVFSLFSDHPDTTAVVSCVGVRTHDHAEARRVCGDANVNIAAAIYTRGAAVRRIVLVSAEPLRRSQYQQYQQYQQQQIQEKQQQQQQQYQIQEKQPNGTFLPTLPLSLSPQWRLWRGYFHGKRLAERAVLENFPRRAVVLRPGPLVYGDGPLALIARPLECALRPLHGACGVCTPPMHVGVLAMAVMRAIEDDHATPGVWDYRRMQQVCAQEMRADA